MNGPNMDQRHLNKPKTRHDVARCNLKKQRMLKDTWFLSSLKLHCPIISFCSRSSFVRNGGIFASVLTPLHHSDILMDAAFLRTGDLVFHILMAFKHLHHEAFLCWI